MTGVQYGFVKEGVSIYEADKFEWELESLQCASFLGYLLCG